MAGDLLFFWAFALLAALIVVPAALVIYFGSVRKRLPLIGPDGAVRVGQSPRSFM